MGEAKRVELRAELDRCPKLEFHEARVASVAGLPADREHDDALGPREMAGDAFRDGRGGKNGWRGHRVLPTPILLYPGGAGDAG